MEAFTKNIKELPNLGLGLGLRHVHLDYILNNKPNVDWFEIISENWMRNNHRAKEILDEIASNYPLVMHGVSMSIGSSSPLNMDYLKRLKELADRIKPKWISDHLCWTGILGINTHDLLPIPFTEESLEHVSSRVNVVQDYLKRPLIIENPSSYLEFKASTMREWEFLNRLVANTGCGLLLDVNNVYVSCYNNNLDPIEYINELPHSSIVQMHIAGHENNETYIIDTHDREVATPVWELFRLAWMLTGGTSTLLEWDGNIPSFEECYKELMKSKEYMTRELLMEEGV